MLVGWRFPRDLVDQVRSLAIARGERPGAMVSRILREQLMILSSPIDSAELEQRMLRARTGSWDQYSIREPQPIQRSSAFFALRGF